MAQRDLPGEWVAKLLEAGFEYRGKASASALAKKADVSPTAALRMIFREGSDPDTILRIGEALKDPQWVADWVGVPWSGRKVDPPAEWHLLDDDEREVLVRAMRLFIRGRGVTDAGTTAEKTVSPSAADGVADGVSGDGGGQMAPDQRSGGVRGYGKPRGRKSSSRK